MNKKLVRITTVPISLKVLLRQQLRFMSNHFDVLAVSSPGKILEEVSKSEGVRIESVLMTRSITPLADLKALWRLYSLFRKEQPDIVHTHTPKAGLLGMLAARIAGVPIRLHTVAGLPLMENKGVKKIILKYTERLTYKCATTIYPNSFNMASYLLKNKYCGSGKLKVLGNGSSNGIDTEYFKISEDIKSTAYNLRESYDLRPLDFIFVFIGRLVKDKGIEELVAAFTALNREFKNIKLLLVGDYEPELDPLSTRVRSIIESDNNIIHVDFQQDIRPYLAISHVLVFPSYREGFPNVPMQAGCFNLPAIVSNINGCNEIIEHGINGLVIPVKNVDSIRDAMKSLMTNKELYMQMKKRARQLIFNRYEQKHFWELLLKEYDEQLERHEFVS